MQKTINTFKTSPEAELAWECLTTTGVNVFLTGKAGTGKTTFLKRLREHCPKRMVVVAPTGVAAINAGGVTIHSMFQMPFGPFIPGSKLKQDYTMRKEKIKIIRTLDLLVIDEISMVRADLLDAVDAYLKSIRRSTQPFGGVQLLMIGDLQQLAPVVTEQEREIIYNNYSSPYFFASKALSQTRYVTIELQQVYRQTDARFLDLLNNVRTGNMTQDVISELNKRYIPESNIRDDNGYIRLTTHNNQADNINLRKLSEIKGHEHVYKCSVVGTFPEMSYPADERLTLKEGAQVMFLKNDPSGQHRYYNGRIGTVDSMEEDKVMVSLDDGQIIEIVPEKWSNAKYVLNESTKEIEEKVEGTFTQIPLRLAWAITIHKSQGLTFDRAIIDAQSSFAHGQVYVALSRCRTLEGLILSSPLNQRSVMTDSNVSVFVSQQLAQKVDSQALRSLKVEYERDMIRELMDFGEMQRQTFMIVRLFEEELYSSYTQTMAELKFYQSAATTEIFQIGQAFVSQIPFVQNGDSVEIDPVYLERITNGAKYMQQKISSMYDQILIKSNVPLGNKEIADRLKRYRNNFEEELKIKKSVLQAIAEQGFSVPAYLKSKAYAVIDSDKEGKSEKKQIGFRSRSKEPKATVQKEKKPSTTEETFALFSKGFSVEDIASARSLTEGTIVGHLIKLVEADKLSIEQVVGSKKLKAIQKAVKQMPDKTTGEIWTMLKDKGVHYAEVKYIKEELQGKELKE